MAYIWGLLTISVIVATMIVVVALPRAGSSGGHDLFARFSIGAGIAAVGSALMYAIHVHVGGIGSLVGGDVLMVLGPGGMLIAVSSLHGKVGHAAVAVGCAALSVALVSSLSTAPMGLLVKVIALTILCVATAFVSARTPTLTRSARAILVVVNGGYALFCVGRIAAGLALGPDSPVYAEWFSIVPTTVVGAICVAALGVAVILEQRGHGPSTVSIGVTDEHRVGAWTVRFADAQQLRTAIGSSSLRRLASDLAQVCADLSAEATTLSTADVHTEMMVAAELRERLAARGWTPIELGMILVTPHAANDRSTHPGIGGSHDIR